MESAIFLVILVVVFVMFGAAGLYAKKLIDGTDPGVENIVNDLDATTAQDFLPFVDINDFMIDLGQNRYRAILECSSVNYNLKTELEREVIELSYQNFISSLSFPITFHIQTKTIDNTLIVRELEKDIEILKRKNPKLVEYGKIYLENIEGLGTYLGDSKQKKKYIIIPYDDASVMGDLNSSEKLEFSKHQMLDRASFIKDQLSSMGIKANLLSEQGLVDLLYNAYHRDNSVFDISEGISRNEFFSSIVIGRESKTSMTSSKKLDLELLKLQNIIKEEFLGIGVNEADHKYAARIYEGLNMLRDEVGKPLKSSYEKVYVPNNDNVKKSSPKQGDCKKAIQFDSNKIDEDQNMQSEEMVNSGFDFEYEESEEIVESGFDFEYEKSEEIVESGFDFEYEESEEIVESGFDFEYEKSEEIVESGFDFEYEESEEIVESGFDFEYEESEEIVESGFDFEYEESEEIVESGFDFEYEESEEIVEKKKSSRMNDILMFD